MASFFADVQMMIIERVYKKPYRAKTHILKNFFGHLTVVVHFAGVVPNGQRLIRHETIHLRHQLEMLILPFYLCYLANTSSIALNMTMKALT
ncbi:hypothetical protein M2273_005984 [Mucilaginibacter lappiensis]|jgi:hypothetical protein